MTHTLFDAPGQLAPGAVEHSIVEVLMGYPAQAERQALRILDN